MIGVTEEFVKQNPALIFLMLAVMGIIIKLLYVVLSKLITEPYKHLTGAITTLAQAIQDIRDDIKEDRKAAKEDREKDQAIVGHLLDRMQAQETKCSTIRNFCPHEKN
jgi:hypothetical protein